MTARQSAVILLQLFLLSCSALALRTGRCHGIGLRRHLRTLRTSDTSVPGPTTDVVHYVEALRRVKEVQQKELLVTELALKRAEQQLQQTRSEPENRLISGTYDYGFVSSAYGAAGSTDPSNTDDLNVPPTAYKLALYSFRRDVLGIIISLRMGLESSLWWSKALLLHEMENEVRDRCQGVGTDEARQKLSQLTLSNKAIWDREEKRPQVRAPWVIKAPYYVLCWALDVLFERDPISRFYFLETVARMPYFSYITMIHTYETLGWWRRSAEAKRVHFAEEYNEYHHLLIWESLGGDQEWRVRFFAQHSAIAYFFVLLIVWGMSPSLAYNFSELIEAHAVDTYAEFAEANKDLLMSMEAPPVAKRYYEAADMYVFDEFQTARQKGSRRPVVNSLYDVVCNIRDDEGEHVLTMRACQDPEVVLRSPNTEAAILAAGLAGALLLLASQGGLYGLTDTLGADDVASAPGIGEAATGLASIPDAIIAAATAAALKISSSVEFLSPTVDGEAGMREEEGKVAVGAVEQLLQWISKFR
mmetsp:Transcript_33058/g.72811  ORF Transcript_33058/g.72811 Transcript_33058/m.72811 type:complete len:531 (+) Transcript_33058:108-1700(+)